MSTASLQTAEARVRERTMLDRVLATLPVVGLALCILIFYGVEAWLRKTPWVFTDELEWSQISRSIASTGHAARRGQPINFKTLYAYVIAPFWWIHSTATAYSAIKYMNVFVMTLAGVPTYLLARRLVTRRAALVVAVLSVSVPAMAYVTTLVPEVLAYPFYALSSWLIVRAFASGKRRDLFVAGGFSLLAFAVRAPQFATIPAAFLIAGGGLWITSPRGRALRSNWTRSDTLGAVVLLIGGLFLFNRVVLQHVTEWQLSTQYWKNRMVDLGLRAALSFVVGMGVLPVIGGFASLRLRERRGDPVYRAFAAYAGATILCVSLYTAVKAAYLSTIFATLWEERNLIYLVPLLLGGTGMWLARRRVDPVALVAATGLVLWLAVTVPLHLDPTPASDAPSLEILGTLGWGPPAVHGLLAGFAVLAALVVLVRPVRLLVGACALVLVWSLASEIYASHRSADYASRLAAAVPRPLEWITQATGGRPSAYVGQEILHPSDIWLQSFWNPSLVLMRSLDGTPGGTGPLKSYHGIPATGDILRIQVGRQGALPLPAGIGFLVGDRGITGAGRLLATGERWHVYTGTRLRSAALGVYSDGWMGARSTFSVFNGSEGSVRVRLSRSNWCGRDVPGRTRIFLNGSPRAYTIVHACKTVEATVPTPTTPFRIETAIHPTFSPAALDPSYPDKRQLGAVVTYIYGP